MNEFTVSLSPPSPPFFSAKGRGSKDKGGEEREGVVKDALSPLPPLPTTGAPFRLWPPRKSEKEGEGVFRSSPPPHRAYGKMRFRCRLCVRHS